MNFNIDKIRKNTTMKKNNILFMISALIFPTIMFCIFYIYSNFDSFFMAFQRPLYDGSGKMEFTTENFEKFFSQFLNKGEVWVALKNTLMYYFSGLIIAFPISLLMTYFIFKKIVGYKIFRVIIYLPSIITATALAVLYRYSLGVGGPYDALCNLLNIKYTYPMTQRGLANLFLVLYNLIFGMGANLVVMSGAFNGVDREVLEAGAIDGCNWFKELVYIIIPIVWPTLSTMLILGTAGILSCSGPLLVFTQGAFGTMTLSYMIFTYTAGAAAGGTQDLNYAAAIGLVMSAITIPIVLITRKVISEKFGD